MRYDPDTRLSGCSEMAKEVNEWRSDRGYGPISFVELADVVG